MKEMLRAWWLEERGKFRRLTRRERLQYILQYYSLWIIGIIGVLWLIIFGVGRLIRGPVEYWVYAVFANTPNNASNGSAIWRDFVAYSGYDTDEKQVEFSNNMYFDYTRNKARGNVYYNSFVALTDSGTLDFITMVPEQLIPLGQSGRLLDLNLERCSELREKYADRLLWYDPPEDAEGSEPVPVAIDISDSKLVNKYAVYPGDVALAISSESTRLDAVGVFLSFILDE